MKLSDRLLDELAHENEMLHAENALKLTQILDLEQLVYDLRLIDDSKGEPCWCANYIDDEDEQSDDFHSYFCIKARKATEPFWKK